MIDLIVPTLLISAPIDGDGGVVLRLDERHEVVLAEDRVLLDDLAAELLHARVDLGKTIGVLIDGLAGGGPELREDDVRGHDEILR